MDAPVWYFTKALSHRQKVLRLYKRALREIDNWYLPDLLEMRYHKVLMRARFDAYKDEKDMRKSKDLLINGVRELWEKRHPQPIAFAADPEGSAFERDPQPFDSVLDHWLPHEKALYPEYFAKRELRKKELMECYDKIMESKEKKVRKDIDPFGEYIIADDPLSSTLTNVISSIDGEELVLFIEELNFLRDFVAVNGLPGGSRIEANTTSENAHKSLMSFMRGDGALGTESREQVIQPMLKQTAEAMQAERMSLTQFCQLLDTCVEFLNFCKILTENFLFVKALSLLPSDLQKEIRTSTFRDMVMSKIKR